MAIFGLATKKEQDALIREINALKAERQKWENWQLQTADAEQYTMPDPSVYGNQADLYRTLSWVLLAVDLAAAAASLTPFSVARVVAGKEPKDIPNHEFEMLLRRPNDLDSRFEFFYATIAYYKLTGNAYWWLNAANKNSPPDEMWVIPSSMIIPVPDKSLYLKGYMYYPGNGREIFMEPHEIVHFRRFNPLSRFVGLSAVEAIALVAAGDLGMQKYNTTLFANNNGRLPSVMTFEQMIADPTWNKIKEDTREAARNREMLMLRGVGAGGVAWLQNAVTQREMEFLEGRKFNKEEIMTTLAPGSYTMLSENATQANSVVGRASFNELTVFPTHIMMGEKITNEILPRYPGRPLLGHFEDIRVTDKDMKLREQEAFERSHTLKEVREEIYGDDPLGDERDELMLSEMGKASTAPGENEPIVNEVNNTKPDNQEMEITDDTEPEDSEAEKVVKAEIDRWKRFALKRVGKNAEFVSDLIGDDVRKYVEGKLPACKSQAHVLAVFDKARVMAKPVRKRDAAAILRGIELAVTALEKRQ